ncbi:unnamed protein product [Spirodela intermedia]|uniref:Uncharacterized protein n=1 Tax=Spirodela intermedia TaxID=51605 RepID=A0A7I8IJ80_SPIIN|nr:unnamed protein product [Spirodela intermedia]CAA6657208.1 unnamed protein product [Spirodela intermedia]
MAQHSSRLQRLLTLLDTGSTQATRFAAARQIGEIAKSHPVELYSLLNKVSPYLRSRNWDTRVAAAHAIGAIAESVKHASLAELFSLMEDEMSASGLSDSAKDIATACSNFHPNVVAGLSFRSFDIHKVLDFGSLLVASGGQEYDVAVDNSKTPAEKLARQKQNLRHRLGLDVCEQFMDVSDMIKDEDLLVQKIHAQGNGIDIQQLVANMVPSFRPRKLSARELNLLKRKAKINAKDQPKDRCEDDEPEMSPLYNRFTDIVHKQGFIDVSVDETRPELDGTGGWPFRHFVEQLIHDMFDPIWEVRHGTIMALREILTHQGACVGVYMPDLDSDMSWIPDIDIKSIKREKETDLNVLPSVDESEPESKRQKLGNEPFQATILKKELDSDTVKLEEVLLHQAEKSESSDLVVADIKTEPDSCMSGFPVPPEEIVTAGTEKILAEDNKLVPKVEFLDNLPQGCKLIKLIKLTRHSWIKNWEFLQDCAIRFICVLALDRFGDYVSDQVVAPVRETCAQGLGAILKYMHPSLVYETLQVLLQMQCRQEWEIRHGSLLGVKYLVAVRQRTVVSSSPLNLIIFPGYASRFTRLSLPACKIGLEDPDDDVRAVAAEALIPAAAALVSLKGEALHAVVILLWDILLYLDDLNPSTSSVMNLLAELYSQSDMMLGVTGSPGKKEFDLNEISLVDEQSDVMKHEDNPYVLSTLAPRLWPFMRHIIKSVRHSAIRTLERLLEVGLRRTFSERTTSIWPSEILGDTLRIVFQNLLLESNEEILHCSERVWSLLLQCPEENLEAASKLYFSAWLQLATTPLGLTLDDGKMFWPVALPRKSHFRAAAKMRATTYENENHTNLSFDSSKGNIIRENVDEHQTTTMKVIFGGDNEKAVTYTRVTTATALGALAAKLPDTSLQVVVDPLWNDVTSLSGVRRQVACLALIAWFKELKGKNHSRHWLLDLLACPDPSFPTKNSALPYAELSRTYTKMRNEARKLFHLTESSGTFKDLMLSTTINLDMLTIDDAINFERHLDDLELSKQRLLSTSCYLNCVQSNLHVSVSALIAAAVVWMSGLPAKLNPIILPLMAAIKREQYCNRRLLRHLPSSFFSCVGRKPGPNDKLIKNICNQTCMDFSETPQAALISSMEVIESQDLLNLGRSSFNRKAKGQIPSGGEDRSKIEGFICRRGSELALKYLCEKFGSSLFDGLPKLWDCLTEFLKPLPDYFSANDRQMMEMIDEVKDKEPQLLINNIQPSPTIIVCICHPHVAVRLAASRCITSMAKTMTTAVMGAVIGKVILILEHSSSLYAKARSWHAHELARPRDGDSDHVVRSTVTHSFAALVPLLPLARDSPCQQVSARGVNWLSFLRRFKLHGILSQWNYCILDEGMSSRMQSLKITNAVKRLKAENRLVLSEQRFELWSLFDFQCQVQATYGKPLLAARDPKCSAKDAEAGALAMEALHKQVMPFLLRRTKDEVLLDFLKRLFRTDTVILVLPSLSYNEQFSHSDAKKEISTIVEASDGSKTEETIPTPKATSHIFQPSVLLKLCSHPLLVLGQKPPEPLMRLLSEVMPSCSDIISALHELEHSPKLVALKEILEECGSATGEHRVLIFAQHRSLLDIIEKDLFQAHMKNVTYLRLDGSVEPRSALIFWWAGLNLTSADTLVFMEHDWNPMKDHQAMDRATAGSAEGGQRPRLIMRGTLEEKVMSLQSFKVNVANAVINAENASLKTMNTDQLLDSSPPSVTTSTTKASGGGCGPGDGGSGPEARRKGLKAVLSGLEELWDQSQYEKSTSLPLPL